MGKIAFVFAGQGAQYVGMGKDIANEYCIANEVYDIANEALGFDIKEMIFKGDEEVLKITENTQPSILTTSVALMKVILEKGIIPDVVAGLSLGEYTAYVASNSIDFKEAVQLVRKRGRFMQEAVPIGVGTMAAILGLENEIIVECCKEVSSIGIVEPANFNCPGQVVIAGEIKAVEKVVEIVIQKGAKRAMVLPVSAPFHCSMLKQAGEKLSVELENIEFRDLDIPLISNVDAEFVQDRNCIKSLLIRQVSSSVLWENSIRKMINYGVETFVEIGPGKVLSGFTKKIDRNLNCLNIEDINSLDKTINKLC